jgi:hypothetical protein
MLMSHRMLFKGLSLALCCVAGTMATGCEKTRINELEPIGLVEVGSQAKLAEPKMILVVPYVVNGEDVKLDSGPLQQILRRRNIVSASDQEKELIEKLTRNLAQGMVNEFQKAGYQAKLVEAESDAHPGQLVVDGTITSADAGNTAKRKAIGFGKGAAKVSAVTRVIYMKGKQPVEVMLFSSEGETSKKPGAAVTMGGSTAVRGATAAASAGAGAVVEAGDNVEGVAHKSGRELAEKILADFPKLGWPSDKTAPTQEAGK